LAVVDRSTQHPRASHGTRESQADSFTLQIIEPHPVFLQVRAEGLAVLHLETRGGDRKRLREIVSEQSAQFGKLLVACVRKIDHQDFRKRRIYLRLPDLFGHPRCKGIQLVLSGSWQDGRRILRRICAGEQ